MPRYFVALGHEQFPPDALLRQAVEAERAGFDGVSCSDHFQPWWEPGESGNAWVWLGAAAASTSRVTLGPGVTAPVYRYHPALVAQQAATLELLAPGRTVLGLGSGESLNESPLGLDWPEPEEQLERLEEAVDAIRRLLDRERLSGGRFFPLKDAYLHSRPERRPPLFVSAFHPGAAEAAARLADGVWILGDPELAPEVIDRYRGACDDEGKEPGEILLQATFSYAPTKEEALEGARVWKPTVQMDNYTDDHHDPAAMYERAEREVSDEELSESVILGPDPEEHAERLREIEQLGATILVAMNASGRAPDDAIRFYGEQVLPRLRGARAAA
jgi:coenzyme F420-dependent glucose-6-phosphate dehydrogenase